MRVIAGIYKSRKLFFPKDRGVRPTMDRVKETIFNVLGPDIAGSRVLDLYAGCGSLGIEALSRGAKSVCFVDNGASAIHAIKRNIETLRIVSNVSVREQTVLPALMQMSADKLLFDYIFMDPPYGRDLVKKTLLKLYQFDILATHGTVIIEHGCHDDVPQGESCRVLDHKQFGETEVTFLGKKNGRGFDCND